MTAARPLPFPPRRSRRPNPPPVSPLVVAAMLGLGVSVAVGLLRWWWVSRSDADDQPDSHDMMRMWLSMQPPAPVAVPTVPSMSTTPTVQLAQQQGMIDALRQRVDMLEQRLSSGGSSFEDRAQRLRRLLEDGRD